MTLARRIRRILPCSAIFLACLCVAAPAPIPAHAQSATPSAASVQAQAVFLDNGPLPLDLLESVVDTWIAEQAR